MARKFFKKFLPSNESVRNHKYLGRLSIYLQHPNLWHLNRHSVSGGVAVGLFSGLVPGPLQMLTAALIAIPLRVNLPIALVTTLYTNPLTIAPLYVGAYFLGTLITGAESHMVPPPEFSWSELGVWLSALVDWTLSLGKPLMVGLVALACSLAVTGYVAVRVGWRVAVGLAWQRRKTKRAQAALLRQSEGLKE